MLAYLKSLGHGSYLFPERAGFVFWSGDGFYNVVGNRHAREFLAHPKIITLGDHHGL